ncbi:MAG: CpsD/CapB family tyrosine-protein kinase, partial [Nitrospiraceae bacterium]
NLRTPFKAIMISSASPGEGKSTTSVNLAMALRELGRRVVLVDADLRHPSLSNLLQSGAEEGVASILQRAGNDGDMTASISVSIEAMGVRPGSDFAFIPSGVTPGDPGALLSSAQAKELVTCLKEQCDYVLFDSPPLLLVSDNLLFATSLDGVILVAKAGQTKKRDLKRAKGLLEGAGARILGVILNQVPPRRLPYYYYGRKYREYYTPRESNNKQ